ncbi:hypothetical protein PRIPAC_92321 [Pristionchus pacificus]|uniref:Ammonium_transp domain-containing protein n=1 Tax=Pristionchus pacificus TaxID=54126 RepID=A0A2A6CDH4_PRIPA|nr:hypothetical protein PRIPAC_92321 [Pristionchus pacificus]|eukprot:PDM76159.1 hypothetical protein PRIPAC_39763 [Pristionchus pacificus]
MFFWRNVVSQTANLFNKIAMRFSRFASINASVQQYQFTVLLLLVHIVFIVLFGVFVSFDELYAMPIAANDNTYLNTKYPYYMGTHVMIFIGFAYLMSFLKRYGYSAISINMLLACVTIEWAVLCRGFFSKQFAETGTIALNIDSLLHSDFTAACVLITMGVVLGKLSPIQYVIMTLIEVPASTATERLVFEAFQINDAGGSMIVHVFGAYFGIALSLAFSRTEQRDHEHDCSIYHTDMFAMLGTLFIFVNWPSLNAATAVTAEEHHRAIINTHLSLVGCTLATFFVCPMFEPKKKFNMVQIANSTIAGGVAIGSCCNVVLDPILSLALGSIAGVVSVLGYIYLTPFLSARLRLHDTCGIHNFHVAYTKERFGSSLPSIYPAMASGDQTEGGQALMQLAGLGTVLGISVVLGGVTGLLLKLPFINQVRDEEYFADGDYFHTPDDYEFTTKISGMVRHHHFEKNDNDVHGGTVHKRMVNDDDEDGSV